MTIKTLVFIHELLIHERQKRYKIYTSIRDKAELAREEETENADFLYKQMNYAWDKQTDAAKALREFEDKEW